MHTILVWVGFLGLICAVIALYSYLKPDTVNKILKTNFSKGKLILIFGGIFLVSMFLLSLSPTATSQVQQDSVSKSEPKKVASLSAEARSAQEAAAKKAADEAAKKKASEDRKKSITYEVLQKWSITNGGKGEVILVSNSYLNETDMGYLGDKIKNDNKDDRNDFIYVFIDKQAAELRDKVLADTASDAELAIYDKGFVGVYNKNGNTGFHEFQIYFDGVEGSNSKIIKY